MRVTKAASVDLLTVRICVPRCGMLMKGGKRNGKMSPDQMKTFSACKPKDNRAHSLKGYPKYIVFFKMTPNLHEFWFGTASLSVL